jgi:hypothetical protein
VPSESIHFTGIGPDDINKVHQDAYEAIAEILGSSWDTTISRIKRARRRKHEEFSGETYKTFF